MSNSLKVRTAATLITCCKINNPINYNYKVMLLKRSKNMKFASTNYVFPGGKFDKSDESLNWLNVFYKQKQNKSSNIKDYFKNLFFNNVNRPNVYLNNDLNKKLPSEVSFRLCAIRETFEETGLLIAYKNDQVAENKPKQFSSFILDKDLIKWLNRIRENSDEFVNMFLEYNLTPDIFSLHDWSSWLTPVHEKNRFDTMFFTCFLNEKPNAASFEVNLDESQKLEVFFQTCTL
jgi:nucleoside diphosphate-linked moiety X motif protein 19